MSEPIAGPGSPAVSHVEIFADTQVGPARLTGQAGTWFDCRHWGHLMFWVEVVDFDGGRLILSDNPSYEAAIIEAEEAAQELGVEVRDLVCAE